MKKVIQYSNFELSELVSYLGAMIGMKELPSQVQSVALTDFIKGTLGRFSPDDFKIAFTLLCENKLDTDREHFQSFSPLYLGRVMDSYSRYRFKYISQQDEPEPVKMTEKEEYEFMVKSCLDAFEKYKEGVEFYDFGSVKFLFLEKNGIISLTKERKNEIYKLAEVEYFEKSKGSPVKKITQFLVQDSIKEVARKIALNEYFSGLIEFEIELKDEIKDYSDPLNEAINEKR